MEDEMNRMLGILIGIALCTSTACVVDASDESVGDDATGAREDACGKNLLHNSRFSSKLCVGCGQKKNVWHALTWHDGVAKRSAASAAPDKWDGGAFGLRVEYDAQVIQNVPAAPNRTYHLSAVVKCDSG